MPKQQFIKHLFEKEECSISEISRRAGVSWPTAAKYAKQEDWNPDLSQKTRRQPIMEPVAELVDLWLMEDRLKPRKERRTAAAIHRQLKDDHGFHGSDRTVRDYVARRKKELCADQERYLELDHPAGDAQVDFGTTHVIWGGDLREIKFLAMSFPFSNAGFCVPVPSENAECFIHAMVQVFERINGVPQRIRFDNLSAAVVEVGKGDERTLTEIFQRFMAHYRFTAEFCGPGRGNEKGHVENKVGYGRRNWLLPYPEVSSFEELTKELFSRADKDMYRPHYRHGHLIAELWERERSALQSLPSIAFEPIQIETVKVDKYGRFRYQGEAYPVPRAHVGETLLLKVWWDRTEVFGSTNSLIATLPRVYTLKTQPIDWKAYFDIFVQKPRGARCASIYRMLKQSVRSYLEVDGWDEYKSRLKFVRDLLNDGYSMETIAEALDDITAGAAASIPLIRHKLHSLTTPGRPREGLEEPYTPESVRRYAPELGNYNRLLPQASRGEACAHD